MDSPLSLHDAIDCLAKERVHFGTSAPLLIAIPKTGTRHLERILRRVYSGTWPGSSSCPHAVHERPVQSPCNRETVEGPREPIAPPDWPLLGRRGVRVVTLVRDPISRFLSAFSFTHGSLLREDSRRPVSNGTALHRALVAFASCGHMHNYQLASLAAKRSIALGLRGRRSTALQPRITTHTLSAPLTFRLILSRSCVWPTSWIRSCTGWLVRTRRPASKSEDGRIARREVGSASTASIRYVEYYLLTGSTELLCPLRASHTRSESLVRRCVRK